MPIIVVADDQPQVRKLLRLILSKQGFVVIETHDGLSAFTVIRDLRGKVSALISDMSMPYFDGASLCRKVRETFPFYSDCFNVCN